MDIKQQTYQLIDDLKSVCHNYGMGNDGNEYKVITQIFLYKFLNDKFGYEIKKASSAIAQAEKWEVAYSALSEDDRLDLLDSLSPDVLRLNPEHLISQLWNQQAKGDFDLIFDSTMVDIADKNIDIFSTQTTKNTKIPLFEKLTNYVTDDAQRAPFARALVDKLVNFSFEEAFSESYDFFAGIFEYVIKDYNTNGGGVYAEYYTPHAIAVIMARLLVGDSKDLHNIECYDPAAGTGTLLMALAHQVGEDKCTIFAQDRSQKSNKMLKLNLILNGLVSSLDHAVQGDTLTDPFHKSDNGQALRQFDYIVCNPPFKLDFSETREQLAAMPAKFWAGVPNIPKKKKESMAIYTCFIQHVLNSLKQRGKGAIVLPSGFITASNGVEGKLLKHIVKEHIVSGVISMPSNVFSNTGTNVSVVFFDNSKSSEKAILIDATQMGEEYQEGNNTKVRLTASEIEKIVDAFDNKKTIEGFSIAVSYEDIIEKNCCLSAGSYFDIKIDYVDVSEDEYIEQMNDYGDIISSLSKMWHDRLFLDKVKLLYDYWFTQFDFPNSEGKPYKISGGEMAYNEEIKRIIPKGWEVKNLSELCSLSNGINYDKNEIGDKEYRIINVRNITATSFLLDASDFDSIILKASSADKYSLLKNDILIARSGTPGAVRLLLNPEDDVIYCGFIIKCTPNNENMRYYLTYVLKSLEGTNATKTGGSILQNVSQETLNRVKVVIPPESLIEAFNQEIHRIHTTETIEDDAINQYSSNRQTYLPL